MTEHEAQDRLWLMGDRERGAFGERLWSNVFRASGVPYVPLCKIETGRAPVIEGASPIVLPDFDCIAENWTAYVDSKCKKASVLYRKRRQERHGVDRKNYLHYERAAKASGKKCAIGIVECFSEECRAQWSGSLLIETLADLGPPHAGESNQGHMVYWPRKQFRDLDSFSALELLAIHDGRKSVSFRNEFEQLFRVKLKQSELFV